VSGRGGRPAKIDAAALEVIRARALAGVCDEAIAAELGVHCSTVCDARLQLGLRSNRQIRAEARRRAVAAMAGRTDREVARALGVSHSLVSYIRGRLEGWRP
jgi:hypothetical protein